MYDHNMITISGTTKIKYSSRWSFCIEIRLPEIKRSIEIHIFRQFINF